MKTNLGQSKDSLAVGFGVAHGDALQGRLEVGECVLALKGGGVALVVFNHPRLELRTEHTMRKTMK